MAEFAQAMQTASRIYRESVLSVVLFDASPALTAFCSVFGILVLTNKVLSLPPPSHPSPPPPPQIPYIESSNDSRQNYK
jgi:hypothetical protein